MPMRAKGGRVNREDGGVANKENEISKYFRDKKNGKLAKSAIYSALS